MYKITVTIIAALILVACATANNYQQMLEHWRGAKEQDLLKTWGEPDAAIKLPSGNRVYMYSHEQLYSIPSTYQSSPGTLTNVNGKTTYTSSFNEVFATGQTVTRYCRTWFETNPSGIIINVRSQGNNCVATSSSKY